MYLQSLSEYPQRWPLASEDVRQLAQLIENALTHFYQCHSSCESAYLNNLHLISNCYQLVLIEVGEQRPLFQFSTPNSKHAEQNRSYSLQLAEMINAVANKVCLIDYPWFYPHFIAAVKNIFSDKLCYLNDDLRIAHRLLKRISHSSHYQSGLSHEIF